MTVKVTVFAKIDGDQLIRAMQLPGLEGAELCLQFQISYRLCTASTESMEEALTFLKLLSAPQLPETPPDPTPDAGGARDTSK